MDEHVSMTRWQTMTSGLRNKNNISWKLMTCQNTLSNSPAENLRKQTTSLFSFGKAMPARSARRFLQIINFQLLLFTLVSSSFPTYAAESPEEIFRFGNHLYQEEDYYRAITEYKRFLHFYPTHPKAPQVAFQIGFSYLKGKKWEAALPTFQKLSLSQTRLKEDAAFAIAQTYFLSGNHSSAIKEWDQFLESSPKNSWSNISLYQKGWAYFLQEKNEEAQQELAKIKNTKLKMKAELLSQEINHWEDLPYRSPFLAGMFSAVLPGSGQWVNGRFWDGAAALTINSMFAYGIYATLDKEYYVPAGILIFFGAGFYGANIFSSISIS